MGKPPCPVALVLSVTLPVALFLASCSNGTIPTRDKRPEKATALSETYYIESKPSPSAPREFSCSFVEFDERGDYLHFPQHGHCWTTIKDLSRQSRVLLILYCHGWKHNAQSSNVLEFNRFLGTLANSEVIRKAGLRVHGVYLSWRGDAWHPEVNRTLETSIQNEFFGGDPIVDRKYAAALPFLTKYPKNLTYWNRRKAAENRVSGVPLSRSVFTYASVARKMRPNVYGKKNYVILMGHSFGALMLEQSVAEASTGALITQIPWDRPRGEKETKARAALPFDLMLFVNSAAPSLYSKMMRDLADTHDGDDSSRPLIVSLTSKADKATGIVHPIGNAYAHLQPGMWRDYGYQIFEQRPPIDPPVSQSHFFRRTPGHNKFLLSHEIVPDGDDNHGENDPDDVFGRNLRPGLGGHFETLAEAGDPVKQWRVQGIPYVEHGKPPKSRLKPLKSSYWIVRCEKDIIRNHNDIWNNKAMQTYAALFNYARALR